MTDWTVVDQEPLPKVDSRADFHALMDKTFGAGKWQETSGYRSPAREDELRAEGAGTVPFGGISRHSLGTPDAPGARDIVVPGMTPAQVARKLSATGADFVHFYPEGAHGKEGAHLHVDFNPGKPETDSPWKVVSTEPDKPAPKKPTPLQKAREKETFGQAAARETKSAFAAIPSEIDKAGKEAWQTYTRDLDKPGILEPLGVGQKGAKVALDMLNVAASPITGLARAVIGRPVETASGGRVSRQTAGDVALLASGFGAEAVEANAAAKLAREEGISVNNARNILARQQAAPARPAAVRPNILSSRRPHNPEIAALERDGVYVPALRKEGEQGRIALARRSESPYVGRAYKDEDRKSLLSLNRSLQNKVLAEIGDRLPNDAAPGNPSVEYVHKQIDAAYNGIKPKMRVRGDGELTSALDAIEARGNTLRGDQHGQLKGFINQVRAATTDGQEMNGQSFKELQSDISAATSEAFRKGDYLLGKRLNELSSELMDNIERHSDPGIRERLKAVNTAFAMNLRLEDAAGRGTPKPGQPVGTFTPRDLRASVRKLDKSAHKNAFNRGDALLSGVADRAVAHLAQDWPSETTRTRNPLAGHIAATVGGGLGLATHSPTNALIGAGLGALTDEAVPNMTNALARHMLSRSRQPIANPRNYLKSTQQRVLAPAGAAHLALPPPDQQ